MTLIKICGITTLDDALHASEAGASALGFNFWPRSKRYITPAAAAAITGKLPAGILKAGVFVDAPETEFTAIASHAGLDIVQLHGARQTPPSIRHWLAFSATEESIRATMETSGAEAFLIDTPAGDERGGTGRTFDWSLVRDLPGRIVLAGGLGPDNVAQAIRQVRPWGVDACSRLESSPGRKDHALVTEFIRAARSATI
ncbi:MAG: N-(5'-phosphoribosyl)anthranilate isomerase [Candidatus Solibacter sp.]|nr:N-(5'-phosphoribosyl)anthranilate isomerase [Candidatus Solibacter sp.]